MAIHIVAMLVPTFKPIMILSRMIKLADSEVPDFIGLLKKPLSKKTPLIEARIRARKASDSILESTVVFVSFVLVSVPRARKTIAEATMTPPWKPPPGEICP